MEEVKQLKKLKHEIFNDHFQNYKRHALPKAQLVIADIPYNVGKNAYGSNPSWYIGGDNANGQSELAGKEFFDTDKDFRISEFLQFCTRMIINEPKETGFGFEIKKDFYKAAKAWLEKEKTQTLMRFE